MTTINYTGFNSPASKAIHKAILIAEANKARDFADLIGQCGPRPYEDEEKFDAHCDQMMTQALEDAEQLMKEAGGE